MLYTKSKSETFSAMESAGIVSEDNKVSSRIPGHVFAPTSHAGWSTASNESLFSIHMGNMSFNESKSGELDSPVMPSPLFDFLLTVTPATEDEFQQNKERDLGRTMSQFSDASVKSFAFPILTEEEERKNDTGKKGSHKKKESSSQVSTSSNTTPEYTPSQTPKPPETPTAETPKSLIPKAVQNGGPRRWFSCFSCFPSCHEDTTTNASLDK